MQQTLFCLHSIEKDICQNRHRGADTSVLADKQVSKAKDRALVLGYIRAAGSFGHTLDEISILLDRPVNRISGRFTELRRDGQIIALETRRQTRAKSWARVYVVAS